jgi:hypothetical protein
MDASETARKDHLRQCCRAPRDEGPYGPETFVSPSWYVSARDDQVDSLLDGRGEQRHDTLRRMLEIAVHDADPRRVRVREPGEDSTSEAATTLSDRSMQ